MLIRGSHTQPNSRAFRRVRGGFSLVELMIAIAVLGAMLALGVPAFFNWLQNSQTRTAAEALRNGLQIARAEAVRLNRNVRFQLTDSAESGWRVNPLDDPDRDPPVGARVHGDGSPNVAVATTPAGATDVTFNSFGQVINADAITQMDVSNPLISNTADQRALRVFITSGGTAKMCDPKVTDPGDPRTCP